MKVRLFAASVEPLADEKLFQYGLRIVSPARREKALSYRFVKDRRLSLGASLLLYHALVFEGFDPAVFEQISTGEHGKPYFENADLSFSLSHSGSYALCAVSCSEVGCDIETVKNADLRIARRFFHPNEYNDILSQASSDSRNDRFWRYWTLKESYIKATGKGMSMPLNSFEIGLEDKSSLFRIPNDTSFSFAEFDSLPDYSIAVSIESISCEAELNFIDFRELLK